VPQTEIVGEYFHREAERFDSIYEDKKGIIQRIIDKLFRGVVRKRFELTVARMGAMKGERVLDVGCGSGRYSMAAALNGAGEVIGVDLASNMLSLAREYSIKAGVKDKCKWLETDFLNCGEIEGDFDYIIAMGFFDYITDPVPFLSRMKMHLDGTLIASFPKRWEFRNFIRKMRLTLFGCGVRYYTISEIKELFSKADLKKGKMEIRILSRDYLVFYSGENDK
jgi:cyclopropane fatty-acyl-phospholipid synthase-like methyltransferase